jgi:Cu+-exporting ATPase
VYEIFLENNLAHYYDFQQTPGATPEENKGKFDFLSQDKIAEKLLEFNEGNTQITTLYIPHIHCSSCIWILENLHKLQKGISSSMVNFTEKKVRITFKSSEVTLHEIALLLSVIGYEPSISLDDYKAGKNKIDRSLLYKLGVAGFAFGNVMFLSFPEYFEVTGFWIEHYKTLFRGLMFVFSLPVVFYAAQDYFISAYKGISAHLLNIDVPIALGILVLFFRSSVEVIFDLGTGFFDSLTGLVFFLLLGKYFQQRTYSFLSFERDYTSYFPIAVTRILAGNKEEIVQIYEVKKGDRLLIRNQELIPVDAILMRGNAQIDYSFVTGESLAVEKKRGNKLFAGGKQLSGILEIEVLASVSQSYLTQLWSNVVFQKEKNASFKTITDRISKHFTIFVLLMAFSSAIFWLFIDASKALNVFTAVLIIACPCAIALAAPFTLGNLLRIYGKKKFYLKNAAVIEQLAAIDTVIFDKTGTITTSVNNEIHYHGVVLSTFETALLKSSLQGSNHPLSRMLYKSFEEVESLELTNFKEFIGKGIETRYRKTTAKIGSYSFVKNELKKHSFDTAVHVSFNNDYKGKFSFKNTYRPGFLNVFSDLGKNYELAILSGDNRGEAVYLKENSPKNTQLLFNQRPEDKLRYIAKLQKSGKKVMMIGDGLNDAGALAQSNVGVSLSENINTFSPACDAILDASKFNQISKYIRASKSAIQIIKYAFLLSFIYNVIGLYFAATGQLMPIIAAILMPLSSISIVVFTTVTTNFIGKKLQ